MPIKLQSTKNAKKASHKCFACSVLIKHHCSFALHEISLKTKVIFLKANCSVKTRLVAIERHLQNRLQAFTEVQPFAQ